MNEIFRNLEYTDDYGFEGQVSFKIFGLRSSVRLHICTDDDTIAASQDASFTELVNNLDVIEERIANAVLEYYNSSEKDSYGPDDENQMKLWWPDINTAAEMKQHLSCDFITVFYTDTDAPDERIQIGIGFNRDWGGEDLEDNGVAVIIQDGFVKEVGFKDIAI